MKEETKNLIATIIILTAAVFVTYSIAYNNEFFEPTMLITTLGIVGVVVVGIVGIIIGIVTAKKDQTLNLKKFLTLEAIFLIPLLSFTLPLSRYHNMNQLERDKSIIATLKVTREETFTKITLPSEQAKKHNSYLNKTLFIKTEGKLKKWKDVSIPHTIGNKKWYVATIPNADSSVTFFFDHCWEDKEITITP